MQGRFQYNIPGTYLLQKLYLLLPSVDTYQFLIQANRQGRRCTKFRHLLPLPRTDGLFYGMQVKSGETLQFTGSLRRRKGPVGVHAQHNLLGSEMLADMRQQLQFFLKINGAYLEFDAPETVPHLFLDPPVHLVKAAHPDQAIDRDSRLSCAERSIPQPQAPCPKMLQRGFQPEQNGRVRKQRLPVYLPRFLQPLAGIRQDFVITGHIITTQSR